MPQANDTSDFSDYRTSVSFRMGPIVGSGVAWMTIAVCRDGRVKATCQAAELTSTTPAKLDGGGIEMPSSRMPSR